MRETRFRAWDVQNNNFINPEYICQNGSGYLQIYDPYGDMYHSANNGEVVLMQFTGLKDKNGDEIYEGDIVTHFSVIENEKNGCPKDDFSGSLSEYGINCGINKNPFPIHRNFLNNPYRTVAYLIGDECRERGCYHPFEAYSNEELMVIGNIYEHKHLIDKE